MPVCKSCNKKLINHLGLTGTCNQLQQLIKTSREAVNNWQVLNKEMKAIDLSNHYTHEKAKINFALSMLILERQLKAIDSILSYEVKDVD